jgi:hypothetical protein
MRADSWKLGCLEIMEHALHIVRSVALACQNNDSIP